MCFLLRLHCKHYGQLSLLHRSPAANWADNVHRLRYKAKQSYVICQICVCSGGHKHPVAKGMTYSKPVHHGVNQLKSAWSLRSVAEELDTTWGSESPERLLAWWRFHKLFEVILIDLFHGGYQKASWHPVDHQTGPRAQGDARTDIYRQQEPWPWTGPQVPPHYWWFSLCSLEETPPYSPAPPLLLI